MAGMDLDRSQEAGMGTILSTDISMPSSKKMIQYLYPSTMGLPQAGRHAAVRLNVRGAELTLCQAYRIHHVLIRRELYINFIILYVQ